MKRKNYFIIYLILSLTFFSCSPLPVKLISEYPTDDYLHIYSVKFTCVPEVGTAGTVFEPALYRTAINIHNPYEDTLTFVYKAISAQPLPGDGTFDISAKTTQTIGPNGAIEVDCDLLNNLLPNAAIGNGFFIIESEKELTVAAVYTSLFVETVEKDSVLNDTFIQDNGYMSFKKNVFVKNPIPEPVPTPGHGEPIPTQHRSENIPSSLFNIDSETNTLVNTLPDTVVSDSIPIAVNIISQGDLGAEVNASGFGLGIGYGLGIGVGTGVGKGIGVGVGLSVDVEYIKPIVIRK